MLTDKEIEAELWYEKLLWEGTIMKIGIINHPKYGVYYIWHEDGLYGITKDDKPPHCGYASIEALLKQKGL